MFLTQLLTTVNNYARGSFMITLKTLSLVDSSSIAPFIASTRPFTINKPSPVPRVVLVVLSSILVNLPKSFWSLSCGI